MEYFIAVNGKQQGPFTVEALRTQHITPSTLVWAPGMSGWQQAGQVAELQSLFQSQQAAPQYQQPEQQQYQQPTQGGASPYGQGATYQQPSTDMISKPVEEVTRSLDDGKAYSKWMPTMYLLVGLLCCILPLVYIIKVINLNYFKDGMKTVVAILSILIFVAAGVIGLFYWLNRRKAVKSIIDKNDKGTLPIVGHFLQSAGESLGLLYYTSMAVTSLLGGILIGVSTKHQGGDILLRGLGEAAEYIIMGLVVICLGRFIGDITKRMAKDKELGS
ncbi:MAG: DUF4339 domain-containing protein [Prevotella sp.]|nr:DUF4339 domain-containing protein [Prevotella sp.]